MSWRKFGLALMLSFVFATPILAKDKPLLMSIEEVDKLPYNTDIYGLSTLDPSGPKKFKGKLLGVLRNTIGPGHNWITVELEDVAPFKDNSIIAGQSGSPVFVNRNGKEYLIGAIAYGPEFSKNPVGWLTPIHEILASEYANNEKSPGGGSSLAKNSEMLDGLLVSVFGKDSVDRFAGEVSFGVSVGNGSATQSGKKTEVKPGDVLGVQLAYGESFDFTSFGTVSYVDGDKVFMFGHPFGQRGPVEYRLVPAKVLGVKKGYHTSAIIAAPIQGAEPVGVITQDREAGIYGLLGKKVDSFIPVTVNLTTSNGVSKVFRFNSSPDPEYGAKVIGVGAGYSVASWSRGRGSTTIFVSGKIEVLDGDKDRTIEFTDAFFSVAPLAQFVANKMDAVMDNKFSRAKVKSVSLDVRVFDEIRKLSIESASLELPSYHAGDTVNLKVVLSYPLKDPKKVDISFKLPESITPGVGKIIVANAEAIESIEGNASGVVNLTTLFESLNRKRRQDALYVYIVFPPSPASPTDGEVSAEIPWGEYRASKTSKRLYSNVEEYMMPLDDFFVSGRADKEFKVVP
jgi:hypothetical protein